MKVDVAEVLRKKNPGAARWIPRFVVSYLKRIVHEDEVNFYLEHFSHLDSLSFIRATLAHMGISCHGVGLEKLDPAGRYIFASNHPFGGLDGLILADKVAERFGDVRVVVNDILMNLDPLKSLFVPVNKHGRQSLVYADLYREAFASDLPIITFPAGLCSRRIHGVVQDREWKHSFVKQAIATHRDVVPVFFPGELSNFFYRLSNFRTGIGLKVNIEMLYLADEMFKQQGRHFDMLIGDPIPWQSLSDHRPREMAAQIRAKVYRMKKNG